ncbi:hypothetical protein [Bradyrhizobium sp. BWA-3-5]|nr:hypothetical protein [Bradyrhizobium sp. BWA-3-5]WOH65655.1 hypothetical protein RX331_34830 [Bradyrhizobium sp. BWA-3-5]
MIQYSAALVVDPKRRGVLDARRSLSSGRPEAGPGGGHDDTVP